MSNQLTTQFNNIPVSIVDYEGRKWLTAEQIGICLGYASNNARHGILKLYRKHADEFTNADKGVVEMTTPGGKQEVTIFSDSGCVLLSMFSNTQRAKDFRVWAKQVLTTQATAVLPAASEQGRLLNAVEAMAENMQALTQISLQQAQKLDVVERYIGLLEVNQKGKVKVTRVIEAQVLQLKAQGMSQGDIARLLRISTTSVSLIVNGRYPVSDKEVLPALDVQAILDGMIEGEKAALLAKLGGGQ